MDSDALQQFLLLEPSLTFQPIEIDYLFYGGPPAAPPHAPQVPVSAEIPAQAPQSQDTQ